MVDVAVLAPSQNDGEEDLLKNAEASRDVFCLLVLEFNALLEKLGGICCLFFEGLFGEGPKVKQHEAKVEKLRRTTSHPSWKGSKLCMFPVNGSCRSCYLRSMYALLLGAWLASKRSLTVCYSVLPFSFFVKQLCLRHWRH